MIMSSSDGDAKAPVGDAKAPPTDLQSLAPEEPADAKAEAVEAKAEAVEAKAQPADAKELKYGDTPTAEQMRQYVRQHPQYIKRSDRTLDEKKMENYFQMYWSIRGEDGKRQLSREAAHFPPLVSPDNIRNDPIIGVATMAGVLLYHRTSVKQLIYDFIATLRHGKEKKIQGRLSITRDNLCYTLIQASSFSSLEEIRVLPFDTTTNFIPSVSLVRFRWTNPQGENSDPVAFAKSRGAILTENSGLSDSKNGVYSVFPLFGVEVKDEKHTITLTCSQRLNRSRKEDLIKTFNKEFNKAVLLGLHKWTFHFEVFRKARKSWDPLVSSQVNVPFFDEKDDSNNQHMIKLRSIPTSNEQRKEMNEHKENKFYEGVLYQQWLLGENHVLVLPESDDEAYEYILNKLPKLGFMAKIFPSGVALDNTKYALDDWFIKTYRQDEIETLCFDYIKTIRFSNSWCLGLEEDVVWIKPHNKDFYLYGFKIESYS